MKKKKNDATIPLVIAVIFVLVLTMVLPMYESSVKNGTTHSFNMGWFTKDADGKEVPFTDFGKQLDVPYITLYHHHDDDLNRIAALAFYNYYTSVQVYTGDRMIYEYGTHNRSDVELSLGNYYCIVDIHRHEMAESDLRVAFSGDPFLTVYGFDGGSGGALKLALVREYILVLATPLISLIALGVGLILKRRRMAKEALSPSYQWLLVFAFMVSAWEMADSQIFMDLGLSAGAVCLASFEIFMLLPIPLLMFTQHSCRKLRRGDTIACYVVFANFVVLNILHFAHVWNFLQSLPVTFAILGAAMAFCLIQVIMEYGRNKKPRMVILLTGYILFAVSSVIQGLCFFVNPTASNSQILQVGFLLFLISQVVSALTSLNEQMGQMLEKLEQETKSMRKTFRRFVPDDRINASMENNESIMGTGKTQYLTVIESDIRGFSEITQRMTAENAIVMLNHYLERMTQIINRYNGIVLEFVGDAVLALFDEEHSGPKHADKAVIAAIQMQYAMNDINEWNSQNGFPRIEMGIGVNSGNAYVGYIGSSSHMEYDAIGSTMNLVSRIQNYSTGGQILVTEECRKNITINVNWLNTLEVLPKGYQNVMTVYSAGGLGDPYNIQLETNEEVPKPLKKPIPVTFNMVVGKRVKEATQDGLITELSGSHLTLRTDYQLRLLDDLRINYNGPVAAKVVSKSDRGVLLRFTSTASDFEELWRKEEQVNG